MTNEDQTEVPDFSNWHHYRHRFRRQRNFNHDAGNIVWGVLFIFIGLTLFLNMVGLVPWSIWQSLISYWPLLLVLGGVQLVLGSNPGADLIVLVVALFVIGSVWTKGLSDVSSPLIYQWSLDRLPWYNWLMQFTPKMGGF